MAECCRAATDVRFRCRRRNGATTDRSEQSSDSFTFVNISCIAHSLHLELSPTCRLKRPLFNESTATATTNCQRDEVGEMKLQTTDSLHVATFRSINTKTDESVRQLPHWPDFQRQFGRWDQSTRRRHLKMASTLFNWLRNVTRALAGGADRRRHRLN